MCDIAKENACDGEIIIIIIEGIAGGGQRRWGNPLHQSGQQLMVVAQW